MTLSKRTVETLIDLVEIKLSCIEVYDRDDQRELSNLEQCRSELLSLAGRPEEAAALVEFPRRSRGRPRAH